MRTDAFRRPWPLPARLIVLLVLFAGVDAAFAKLTLLAVGNPITGLLCGVVTAGLALLAYVKVVGLIEQRPATEVSPPGLRSQLPGGVVLGAGMFAVTVLLIAVSGGYRASSGSIGAMVATLGLMVCVATCEELLFRGVLLRVVEQWAGTVVALIASSALFGGLHMLNPDATLWGAVAIAFRGGLLTGLGFVLTRKLWLPIGFHLGWNFAEAGIFGTTVSGSADGGGGLLRSVLTGPNLITGGEFGPEASIYAVLLGGSAAAVMLFLAHRQGKIRPASWSPSVSAPAR